MKLYAAMLVGIAVGTGLALLLAARELEDSALAIAPTMPVTPASDPPRGA